MMIENFIDRLEQRGLLDKAVVEELRRKVGRAPGKKITPEAIAKYLVDKGHLTRFQATKLVSEATSYVESGSPPKKPNLSDADELALLPEDAEPRPLDETKIIDQPSSEKPVPTADEELDDLLAIDDRSDVDRRLAERKEAAERRKKADEEAAERRAVERKAAKKKVAEKKAAEEKAAQRKRAEQRAAEKREADRRAAEKREMAKRETARRAADQQDSVRPVDQPGLVDDPDLVELGSEDDLVELPPSPTPAGPPRSAPVTPPRPPRSTPPKKPVPPVDDLADLEASSALEARKSPTQLKLQKSSEWDSMLMLVGGASLGVLLVLGAFLYFSLTRGVPEELLAAAEQAYRDESYSLAIKLYDEFVEDYSGHEKASMAKVKRESARLRQVYKDPERGLKVAREELPKISQEEAFPQIRDELASMLPQIARGFVDQAMLADDPAVQEQLLISTRQAMELVDNPEYIPSTLRKSQQTTITGIEEDVARVTREIDRERNLVETINAITSAVSAGDTQLAYEAREQLLSRYPGLDTSEQLYEAVLTISEKEREKVQVVQQPMAALNDDVLSQPAHVIVAHQMGQAVGGVNGHLVYVLAAGSVFAFDASTGHVLWRRFVGVETTTHPTPVSNAAAADVIVVDRRRQEVMRLTAQDGKVVWRLPVGEPFADPVVGGDVVYVSTRSGRLLLAELETGNVPRYVQIPQPLEVGTGVDLDRRYLYQPGDQDNLFVISRESLQCEEAFYIGHRRGTITVPPVMSSDFLFVVENAGPDFSFLHVITCDEQGVDLKTAQKKIRLQGQVLVQPLVSGGRVLVVTDQRAIELFVVEPNNENSDPVVLAHRRNATKERPIISYPLLAGSYMWVANNRFTKYQVQATTGKMPSEWVLDERDVYVGPLQQVQDVIVHVRRRQGATGYTVGATKLNEQEPSWQTEIAAPIRNVVVDGEAIEAVTSRGRLFDIDSATLGQGVVNQAQASALRDERLILSLTNARKVVEGTWALTPESGYNQIVFHRKSGEYAGLKTLTLTVPLGQAAIEPTPFRDGLLIPLRDGMVTLVDQVTGGERARPFHPSIEAGTTIEWLPPAILGDAQEFAIANDRNQLFRVGINDRPQRHLQQLNATSVAEGLYGRLAALDQSLFGVTRAAEGDALLCFALPETKEVQRWTLAGRLLWGPERVGDVVLVATDSQLICTDAQRQQKWAVEWEHGAIVGSPVAEDGQMLLATSGGTVVTLDMNQGETIALTQLGEPLTGGPVVRNNGLLVSAESGVLFVIDRPGRGG
jgi:outer membrane protein assembly factor BamB